MKAIVNRGPLRLEDVPKPVPKYDELLVRVEAATVTRGDVNLRKIPAIVLVPMGMILGFKKMKVPGIEFSGTVESTGSRVTLFKKGDELFGTTTGLTYGANAEYVCIPERWKMGVVMLKPKNLSFEESAAIPVGGMTALYNIKRMDIRKGQKVLVYGASGSVGSYAVQIAKNYGAEVTGVCSTNNIDLVRSLGADHVLDYTKDAIPKEYDAIFDAVGKMKDPKKHLKKGGHFRSIRTPTKEITEDLLFIRDLAEAGRLRAVIDKKYTLDQVPEAHRYVEQGHKRGNIVVTFVK
ncbi:MAG: NAD(P)-dependent alcohol dehydrogenase [Candidatus Thermoplasmatota archaeon]|nr:NAD(P)-dependent alcohol dehydrogenase [Candidatus Thermoplasmatota archaeon]